MPRIRGETLADIQFRQNDTAPTRAQKLELLRAILAQLLIDFDALPEQIIPPSAAYRIPGYFVAAPAADETLHLHSVTDPAYIPANFEGSEAHVGSPPAAEFVITIYRNPEFTGLEISGGEVIGYLTYNTDGTVLWESVNSEAVQLEDGDLIGLKAPAADAAVALGSFTIYAIVEYIANLLALTGDQQEADGVAAEDRVVVLLSGDQQAGGSAVVLSGDQKYG